MSEQHTDIETMTDAVTDAGSPRTRWAAIVWGLFFAVCAGLGFWTLADGERRAGVVDALMALSAGTIVAWSALAVGILVLLTGLVGLIRRAQRRVERGPAEASSV